MSIYIICAFILLGNLSRGIFNKSTMSFDIYDDGTDIDQLERNRFGSVLGTILIVGSLIYGLIHFSFWSLLFHLGVCFVLAVLTAVFLTEILTGYIARLIFIWIIPIVCLIVLILGFFS